ncbi:MAG: alkaline phosphatase family protein [Patescibacteria group bacterium]|jgi:predicted AlkP superfamily phosphohydrolase/phosphomutase
MKIITIGLDGMTFKLLDPLLAGGQMPNLKKLVDGGVRGILLSTKPPVTAPAWTTFATGVNPGKHGCYDFCVPGKSLDDFKPVNSNDIKVPTIEEILHAYGKKAVLINLPNSFPPKVAEFPTITSLMTIGDKFIFPETLINKYPELKDYRLTPDENIKLTQNLDAYIQHIIDLEQKRILAVKKLFLHEDWDFFFFLFSSTDWISHLAFAEMVKGENPEAMKLFAVVDDFFGWLLEHMPAQSNIYILSDHGFTYYTELFYINRWLEQQGYLVTTNNVGSLEETMTARRRELDKARSKKQIRLTINKNLFKTIFFHPALEKLAKKFFRKVVKKILPIHVDVNIGIDMQKTKVCFPRGSMLQTLYVNYVKNFANGIVKDETEYNKICTDIKTKLEQLYTPSGKRVTEHVYTKPELYGDNPPLPSPDLHCATKDVWIVGHLHSKNIFEQELSNKHDEFGVFMAYGADIKAGEQLPDANLCDLMPTILHHLGLPVPDYSDGQVLQHIFRPETTVAQNTPNIQPIKGLEQKQLQNIIDNIGI